MAQDQTAKRLNLASTAMDLASRYVDLLADMQKWAQDANTNYCGNFVQSEFDNTAVKHITPGMLNVLRDNVIPRLQTQFTDAADGNETKQTIIQLLP